MREGKIFVEITTPNGERIAHEELIACRTFFDALQPVHINKNPFVPDDEKEIENIKRKRESFASFIADKISYSFTRYFETQDTRNGYPISKG